MGGLPMQTPRTADELHAWLNIPTNIGELGDLRDSSALQGTTIYVQGLRLFDFVTQTGFFPGQFVRLDGTVGYIQVTDSYGIVLILILSLHTSCADQQYTHTQPMYSWLGNVIHKYMTNTYYIEAHTIVINNIICIYIYTCICISITYTRTIY